MEYPKVTILIPVYNRNGYISKCIDSALAQTFPDLEVVIVDNASNDGTWEICQQYAARDSRVRIFRNAENIGPVRNWMRCAREARGEFSKILFSDDLLEANCVEQMLKPFDDPQVGFVSCAARIGKTKEESVLVYSVPCASLIPRRKYLSLLLDNRSPYSPGAVMLRTKDLLANLHDNFPTTTPQPFDRHGAGPDVMIMLLTAMSYPGVMCIESPLVFFRVHASSFTAMNTNNAVSAGYVSAIAFFLRKNGGWHLWLKYVVRCWVETMRAQRHWINPLRYLRAHEGNGSIVEVFLGGLILPFILGKKTFRKISRDLLALGRLART